MNKIKKLIILYIFQIFLYSPEIFAIGEKELAATSENTSIIFSFFSTELLLNIVFAIIVIILTLAISKLASSKITSYLENSAEGDGSNKEELIGVLTRTSNISILLIGFSITLGILGVDTGIFMGGIGFGLGFTLKIFLTNFMAGVMMVTQGFYHNGDLIEISGKTGKIKKINALFTSVEQFDGVIFFVPNVKFLEENVENYNTNDKRRVDIEVGVDYDTDILKAKKIMLNILGNFPNIIKAPNPVVMIADFGDSSIDLCLRFWISTAGDSYFETKSNVMETINLAFKNNGIVIPFPQVTLSNREGSSLIAQK